MTAAEQKQAAEKFAAAWQGRGDEKQETQSFWLSLLREVYGVQAPADYIRFELPVKIDHTSFIDGYIPATRVLIEQKGADIDLKKGYRQSDGSMLTPFQQARRYAGYLPHDQNPRWIVMCNFQEFRIHDMNRPNDEPEVLRLSELGEQYHRMQFLVDTGSEQIKREMEVSIQAGNLVGLLYDEILKQYKDPTDPHSLKSLNMLCVRLVFCLYAEDAGIFGRRGMFHDYLKGVADIDPKGVRRALIDLFRTLDTKEADRDPYMDETLAAFPYVNGGLFADENIEIPQFTPHIIDLMLRKASEDFDWSEISPTIFGAVFESTLNPETRRSGGMHYTSIENIHKVIDPLFLDDLRRELDGIRAVGVERTRRTQLQNFQKKLAGLTFLDPACGSGNFLTETYLSLRRLENEVIGMLHHDQMMLGDEHHSPVQVSISQFYGIEINDFAVTVAKTALWIAESQMLEETKKIIYTNIDFLPLKTNASIVEANALTLDWETVVPKAKLNYIMGNPPFVGARMMVPAQKDDLRLVFGSLWKNLGNLDYVAGWYKKAADYITGTAVRTALVSTNSVSQGEAVANLWKPLFADGVHIDFAHRTFRWDSEAKIKAHVHCVIIGFSKAPGDKPKVIYSNGEPHIAHNINGYLLDAENVSVESRSKPLCAVPEIGMGNQPIDNGNYLFEKEEMEAFLKKEPAAAEYFHPWYGAYEFINRKPRYCLWLGDCTPAQLRSMPECLKRVQAVREYRLSSKRQSTLKLADKPARFQTENMPKGTYIILPKVSSEKRRYIPMGFMSPESFSSDLVFIIPNSRLYHFGVLTSNVHMSWMRTVCGRLKSDYRYSKDVVYNNFIWPDPTPEQKARIEQTAQGILDARALYPDSSLADLYDEATMPPELRRAHQQNDRAVMAAYGFSVKISESDCVAALMKLYQQKTGQKA
ncbi:class I SAM-dependent DNA methyltransferase [Subdoligranulum sp. DSM 109015]|uniref:site-specific DNA-methyltransferase (adenine-specific) n=1 Tax=Gemmiger gallinarum TaxID=2779354 RepID=A0ABR9R3T7_9FIRM|nr:class I SAM-dependent DNA methyltransferase [Gemmiger gallinarum]MBE5037801.1 class I SAM-dependent DNA methyltransferase [Gemmiger gallinarum]